MSQVDSRPTRRTIWGWLPGVIVSLLAIWLLARLVTWQQVVDAVQRMDPRFIPLALVCYLIGMFTRTLAWHTLLRQRVAFPRVFFAMNEGYLLNNIFPLRLGELGRAVLLGRSSGLGMLPVLSTIIIERSFDMAISAGLLLATLPLALGMAWARPLAWVILSVVIAGLLGLYFAARFHTELEIFFQKRTTRWPFFQKWALPKLISLVEGFSALTDLRLFAASLGLLLVSWFFAIGEDWILLHGVVANPPFWWGAFIIGVTALGGALPSVSGAVGVLEAAIVGGLVVLKVNPSAALAYGIVLHIIHFSTSSLLGMVGLARDGESLSGIYRELRFR
ncbi:MAG: lysylphosphatidylglycerol synthase transmembrane domain-containing protein [Anaerolineaceae bacterium]|nr:lysylphosphatidylglycerol synthase transmembrane domain-containing protein [Anaerolineaceae bacterium]